MAIGKFIEVILQIFLITLVITTWILPTHYSISRDSISALLLTYVSAGSDIAEFFSMANQVKENYILVDCIFGKDFLYLLIFLTNLITNLLSMLYS
jgi:hypothetical protein